MWGKISNIFSTSRTNRICAKSAVLLINQITTSRNAFDQKILGSASIGQNKHDCSKILDRLSVLGKFDQE